MDGNTARGASSPANPALHMPEPLSTTRAAESSSHIFEEMVAGSKWSEASARVYLLYLSEVGGPRMESIIEVK